MKLKSYIIPALFAVVLLFALVTNIISIKDLHTNQQPIYDNFQATQERITVPEFKIESLEQISGELLISPKDSWQQRSQFIKSSKNFLYIWMYNVTHRESRALIKSLAKQGVDVKMIIEDDKYGIDDQVRPRGWGIQTQNDDKLHTNFVHAKVLISQDFYIIQTANLTFDGFEKQREYYVLGKDPAILDNLKLLFAKDRTGERILPSDIHSNLIFCPIDCREKITGILRAAKRSIYIENQYLDDPEIIRILEFQRNLDTRIVLPKDEKNAIDATGLESNTRLLASPRIHAKSILVDDTYLVISSVNFSANSLDNNREIGIIITNREAIELYKKQFLVDWNRAK